MREFYRMETRTKGSRKWYDDGCGIIATRKQAERVLKRCRRDDTENRYRLVQVSEAVLDL
jgi:hypothetical protein